jgi:hypothetical protein
MLATKGVNAEPIYTEAPPLSVPAGQDTDSDPYEMTEEAVTLKGEWRSVERHAPSTFVWRGVNALANLKASIPRFPSLNSTFAVDTRPIERDLDSDSGSAESDSGAESGSFPSSEHNQEPGEEMSKSPLAAHSPVNTQETMGLLRESGQGA